MKVQALRDIAGSYGFCSEGQVINISAGVAKELENAGLVKVLGDGDDNEPEADSEKEQINRAKAASGKSSVKLKNAKQDN